VDNIISTVAELFESEVNIVVLDTTIIIKTMSSENDFYHLSLKNDESSPLPALYLKIKVKWGCSILLFFQVMILH